MSATDARTARAMAQRVERAVPVIQQSFIDQKALFALAQNEGRIKYGGYGTQIEWYVRKETADVPNFGGGELSVRTFTEVDPASKVYLPYCWVEKTYGVSDRTLETNRNATGSDKIYDSLKENLIIAQINMYDALCPKLYVGPGKGSNNGNGGETPIGLYQAAGSPYTGGSAVTVTAGQYYANKILNTSAVAAYSAKKAGYDSEHWAPTSFDVQEVPGASTSTWAAYCLNALAYMAGEMEVTANASGTGKPIKPDIALMDSHNFADVVAKVLSAQATGYQIPVRNVSPVFAKFPNIVVDTLTCVKDTDVNTDSAGSTTATYGMVYVLDSSKFWIATTHKKSEGLIKNEFLAEGNNPMVSGAIGVLKANLMWYLESPTAIGCIVGTD